MRKTDQRGRHLALRAIGIDTRGEGLGDRGEHSVASETDGHFLIRRQRQRRARVGNAADHETAVEAVDQGDPFGIFRTLIAKAHVGLQRLIVVDPEDASLKRRTLRDEASILREEETRACVAKRPVRLKSLQVGGAHASSHAVELGVVPRDGERDIGVQQRAEVESVVRVLPEIIGVDQDELADGLLKTGVELVAETRLDGNRIRSEHGLRKPARAGSARQQQVFVERRLHRAGVREANHGSCALDVVSQAEARLGLGAGGKPGVVIHSQADVDFRACPA